MKTKSIFGIISVVAILLAQGPATINIGGHVITINPLAKSTVTLSLSSASADASGNATLAISMSTTRRRPAAVQFDLVYTDTDVTSVTVTNGAATTAAAKSNQCVAVSTSVTRCIISGGNTTIQNGIISNAALHVTRTTTVSLANVVVAAVESTQLISVVSTSGGIVTVQLAIINVSCVAPPWDTTLPLDTFNIEPGEQLSCTATANTAPTSPATIPVTISAPVVTVSPVVIAGGTTATQFTITGN